MHVRKLGYKDYSFLTQKLCWFLILFLFHDSTVSEGAVLNLTEIKANVIGNVQFASDVSMAGTILDPSLTRLDRKRRVFLNR